VNKDRQVIKIPQYGYKCDKCDKEVIEDRFIKDRKIEKVCDCGGIFKRDFQLEHRGFMQYGGDKGYWSMQLGPGPNPDQIAEERAAHPDREIDNNGRVFVKGLSHQKRLLKELGMVDLS
jgi:predicted nucleic acid-binding Zn ribbon protein